jgi:hypothetical protein
MELQTDGARAPNELRPSVLSSRHGRDAGSGDLQPTELSARSAVAASEGDVILSVLTICKTLGGRR